MFGKSDVYGFYVLAYDANTGKIYSWPKDTALEKNPHIPAPLYWGELVSPDKSIPEFEVPLFLLLSILFMVIFTNNKLFTRSLRCS